VFEKHDTGKNKVIGCLWRNEVLNIAMRPVERENELVEIMKDWLK